MTDPAQKAAYIMAQVACMQAKMHAMMTANTIAYASWSNSSKDQPFQAPYTQEHFEGLPGLYGVHHNAVVGFLND